MRRRGAVRHRHCYFLSAFESGDAPRGLGPENRSLEKKASRFSNRAQPTSTILVANEGKVAFSTVSEGNSRLRDSIPENPTTKRARHALFGRTENSCRHAPLALAEWI